MDEVLDFHPLHVLNAGQIRARLLATERSTGFSGMEGDNGIQIRIVPDGSDSNPTVHNNQGIPNQRLAATPTAALSASASIAGTTGGNKKTRKRKKAAAEAADSGEQDSIVSKRRKNPAGDFLIETGVPSELGMQLPSRTPLSFLNGLPPLTSNTSQLSSFGLFNGTGSSSSETTTAETLREPDRQLPSTPVSFLNELLPLSPNTSERLFSSSRFYGTGSSSSAQPQPPSSLNCQRKNQNGTG